MSLYSRITEFNYAALPRKAMTLAHTGVHTILSDQYIFEKTQQAGAMIGEVSKFRMARGRVIDNISRKLSSGDIEVRPIMYSALNIAESVSPFLLRTAMKASANPIAMGVTIAVAGLMLDETTRSIMTEQVSNVMSLFNTQVHDVEDRALMHDMPSSASIKDRDPSP